MNELVQQALDLLPAKGEVEFDEYKAQLFGAMPDKAKDVFTYALKNNLVNKRVEISDHVAKVYLSKKV